MTDQVYGCVLYTDGGCKPSRGIGGWGMHGYLYTDKLTKTGTGLKDHSLTESGYVKEGKNSRVAPVHYYDGTGSLIPESTNNEAELMAFIRALETILQLIEDKEHPINKAVVYSDSKYTIKGKNEWLVNWKQNNWTKSNGEPISNIELWKKIDELGQKLEQAKIELDFEWIEGHSGFLGNELAHNNAELGIIAGRKGIQTDEIAVRSATGYWSPKVEPNRMFAHSRWYFNTNVTEQHIRKDGRYVYHLGDHGTDDDFLGKRMSDAAFSVIYTKEPEPVLETIRHEQDKLDPDDFSSIAIGRLDWIFRPVTYKEIEKNGGTYLHQQSMHRDLYNPEGLQLTRELNPPRLAFNLVDVMWVMESILDEVSEKEDGGAYTVTDLTGVFYEPKSKKGYKIKDNLSTGIRSVTVDARYKLKDKVETTPLTLTVGMDTPHRNALAALAKREVQIKLVTWKVSKQAFRYATFVRADEDVGLWAGFYANIHLLS